MVFWHAYVFCLIQYKLPVESLTLFKSFIVTKESVKNSQRQYGG